MHAGSAADPVTVSVNAPASVIVGSNYDYSVVVTYSGELTAQSPEYSVTSTLPSQVKFLEWGIVPQGQCPTAPQPGGTGTVACTVQFTPTVKTVTIRIRVLAATTGAATLTAQLSTGSSGAGTTSIDPAPPGSIAVTMTGPRTIQLSETSAPARFAYTISMTYNGPPIDSKVDAAFTDRLPDQVRNPGIGLAEGVLDCTFPDPAPAKGGVVTCGIGFTEDHRTRTVELTARPTGATGTAVNTLEVSTGGSVTWSTTIEPPPSAQPSTSTSTAPAPVSGPAAAPTATVAETFTTVGSTEPESVNVSPTTETVQVALTWPAGSSFDATGFTLTSTRTLAGVDQKARLRITKKRGARWLDVRIKGVHRGKLTFKIVAKRLKGRTRVVAKIRQSKRG
jgi:hypothetical protein